MKIIKPSSLKPGDTLGIVACSTPINASSESTINRCYAFLKEKGFQIVEAPNCRQTLGHTAGSIKDRVKALHDFFKNKRIDAILSYWGGFQSHQLLEHLDFDLIRKNPKPFIGFSDTTSLHVGIHAKTGLVTFSGPAGITFGKPNVPEFTWSYFEKVLLSPESPLNLGQSSEYADNKWWMEKDTALRFKPNSGWKVFMKGKAKGRLIGGNLGTMLLLAGTDYWPNLKGAVLFVEDDEAETSKTMDRMFTQLRQMGVYDQIAGMIVGRFHSDVRFTEQDSLEMILRDTLKGYKFPVITDVDFGHTDPLLTVPLGIQCEVNTSGPSITFLEKAVR